MLKIPLNCMPIDELVEVVFRTGESGDFHTVLGDDKRITLARLAKRDERVVFEEIALPQNPIELNDWRFQLTGASNLLYVHEIFTPDYEKFARQLFPDEVGPSYCTPIVR